MHRCKRSEALFAWLVWLSLLMAAREGLAEEPLPPQATLGVVEGRVRFTGAVPPPQTIMTTDGQNLAHHDLVVDAKTKGLRFVAVILENAPAQPEVKKAKPVVVDQREMIFLPRVVAVQQGQAVRFENNDQCNHSVQAASPVSSNQFHVFVTGSQPYERVFDPQKQPVEIGCSLHAWMRAWVYIVPHPWFAVTDGEGKFKIDGVPPGKYRLWLRHADSGHEERKSVEVHAGQTTELTIGWSQVRR